MLDSITAVLEKVDGMVWGWPLMILIIAGGVLLTIRTGVLQFRKLPLALKWMVKNEEEKEKLLLLARFVQLCQQQSEQEISLVWLRQCVPEVRAHCSGCWWQHSSEWRQNFLRVCWQSNIV